MGFGLFKSHFPCQKKTRLELTPFLLLVIEISFSLNFNKWKWIFSSPRTDFNGFFFSLHWEREIFQCLPLSVIYAWLSLLRALACLETRHTMVGTPLLKSQLSRGATRYKKLNKIVERKKLCFSLSLSLFWHAKWMRSHIWRHFRSGLDMRQPKTWFAQSRI